MKFVQKCLIVLAVPIALAAGAFFIIGHIVRSNDSGIALTHTGPTVTELENLGHLTVVRVHVADVIEGEWAAWYGQVRGAWIVKGDALLAVDMRNAEVLRKDEDFRTAVIVLPRPGVIQARVNHEQTRTYSVQRGFLISKEQESQLRDHAMRQAQMFVEHAAETEEAILAARATAEKLIRQFYALVGWDVSIVWRDHMEGV